eukprot:12887824-Prorocentrum_lima.AAC.1
MVGVMREVIPTKDFSRLSMVSDVQTKPTMAPSTTTGLAQRLEECYSTFEMATQLGCAMEPRVIMLVLTCAVEKVVPTDQLNFL